MILPVINLSISRKTTIQKQSVKSQYANQVNFGSMRSEFFFSPSVYEQLAQFKGPLQDALKDLVDALKPLKNDNWSVYTKERYGSSPLKKGLINIDEKSGRLSFIQNLADRKREINADFDKQGALNRLTLSEVDLSGKKLREFSANNPIKGSYDYFAYQFMHVRSFDILGNLEGSYAADSAVTFFGHDGRSAPKRT